MTRWSAVTLISTLSLLAPVSYAQGADADEARTRARALAEKGDAAFAAGRCDQAIPLWSQAEETFHAPTIQLRIANCYALLGKVVQAERVLTLIASERLSADAPDAFRSAQEQAVATLPTVRSRIATIEVAVDRANAKAEPRVFVDDEPVAAGTARVRVDPGRHRVRVEAGNARWETSVKLDERGHAHVAATLREEVAPAPARPQRTVGLILGGVGLATAAVGSYFGVRALGKSSDLKDVCGPQLDDCPADRQGDIDQVNRDSKIADITMAAGGVLFLAGAVVMVTEPTPEREAPTLRIVPMGLGAGLRGAF
jgi:hypothetical protein